MTPPAVEPDAGAAAPKGDGDDSGQADSVEDPSAAEALRERARRRRRVDEIFGDVLPDVTSDERRPGHHAGFTRSHYEASKPPHWG